jgi:transcriptional regulator with PAS, ATPase and Fis domain
MDTMDYSTHLSIEHLILPHEAISNKMEWSAIEASRLEFLANPSESFSSSMVRPEIRESWVRSSVYGIDPEKKWLCIKLSDEEYQQVYDAYEKVIEIAKPIMHMIEQLQLSSDYIFELMGRSGISLYQIGNMNLHKHIASKSIFNEATMGTNAHSLSMRHGVPFMVIGPEHFCTALHKLTACAVPIFDSNNTVIASLLFTRANPTVPWSQSYHKLLSHTVGLVTSIAAAIEGKLVYQQCFMHIQELEDKVAHLQELKGASAGGLPSCSFDSNNKLHCDKNGEAATITFDDIIGSGPAITKTMALAKRFAKTDENILIYGESGTGKELFAQAIHNHSHPQGPFMTINCAAIPHRLIESELFGYEDGTFTGGVHGGKAGKIELAHSGTLFLDEIGDMPLELQATLLRVLENKRVMRLGSKSYRQVCFRVIAATNRNLMDLVAEGKFREDLFYRLSILTLDVPPLRFRLEDMDCLIKHFLDGAQRKSCQQQRHLSPDALKTIMNFSWPGNVRQLKNALVSAYHAAPTEVITCMDLPTYMRILPIKKISLAQGYVTGIEQCKASGVSYSNTANGNEQVSLPNLEELAVRTALERTDYNVTKAAELLEISRATIYRKIKEYKLNR